MKRTLGLRFIMLPLLLLYFSAPLCAQDTLLTVSCSELYVKLLEIGPTQLRFFSPPSDTVVQEINTTEIFMIKFANGNKMVFTQHIEPQKVVAAIAPSLTNAELRRLGTQDARRYYGTSAPFWVTGAVSLLNPVGGLVTAVVYSASQNASLFRVSDPALRSQPVYVDAYKKEAVRKRKGSAFLGFGVGTAAFALVIYAMLSAH